MLNKNGILILIASALIGCSNMSENMPNTRMGSITDVKTAGKHTTSNEEGKVEEAGRTFLKENSLIKVR